MARATRPRSFGFGVFNKPQGILNELVGRRGPEPVVAERHGLLFHESLRAQSPGQGVNPQT